jgi:hypothetical protein
VNTPQYYKPKDKAATATIGQQNFGDYICQAEADCVDRNLEGICDMAETC